MKCPYIRLSKLFIVVQVGQVISNRIPIQTNLKETDIIIYLQILSIICQKLENFKTL